jgi:hypothetical protein
MHEPVVKVGDLLGYSARWGLGILSAIIVLGIGTLVQQTLARSRDAEETRRIVEDTRSGMAALSRLMDRVNAEQDRRIESAEREIELLNEQVRLLWRR